MTRRLGNKSQTPSSGDSHSSRSQVDNGWLSSAIRVGVDVTVVSQVRQSVARFGDRYLKRIFTAHELACCESEHGPLSCERLAARFAAEEATLKVLRVSTFQPAWTDMEVRRHPTGWCEMTLGGSALVMAATEGILHPLSLSLTHEGDLAMAVVITFSASSPDKVALSGSRDPGSL